LRQGGRRGALLAAVVAAAIALRLLRAVLRWDEIALAYAAYQQPWLDAAARGDLRGVLGTFTGLHPPLYSALFGLVDALWGAPAGWLALSVALSAGAVAIVGRTYGPAAAAVVAADPLQLAYAAEINNYPLLVFAAAACLWARERAARGLGAGWLMAAGVLAGWSHLLGGVFGGLCALSLLRREPRAALAVLGAMAAGCAPVVVRALSLAGAEGTYGQAGLDWAALGQGLGDKVGWWGAAWALALLAGRRRPGVAFVGAGVTGAILAMMALGVAAPHQQPYWLLVGPPAAALLAAWAPAGWAASAAGLAFALPGELERLERLRADRGRPRGIDYALAQAAPGDALWLLAPALKPDDDKTDSSDVLWRFSTLAPAPPWRGPGGEIAFEYTDYGFGQPRWLGGRVVHTSTDLWPDRQDAALRWHLEAGREVWFVLYDHGPANDYDGKLDRSLRPYAHSCRWYGEDAGLGVDRVCHVTGLK
jgi:hypothetical protein